MLTSESKSFLAVSASGVELDHHNTCCGVLALSFAPSARVNPMLGPTVVIFGKLTRFDTGT